MGTRVSLLLDQVRILRSIFFSFLTLDRLLSNSIRFSSNCISLFVNPKKSSLTEKISTRENSLFGGDADITEQPIEPIKVYSEKELIREFEKLRVWRFDHKQQSRGTNRPNPCSFLTLVEPKTGLATTDRSFSALKLWSESSPSGLCRP
ncbi:hypothetical protein AALP_AA7G107200 [Arabis alpina]|uniref:Uncharacterized protein n=1 Tax=Arabis alpina TaxID=50452 RepID=A0A087GH85_ARAAL|nr:hypothetical protein AALP_AA7G107200 [Arabis alpina]